MSRNFLLSTEENSFEKILMAGNFSALYSVVWPEKTVIKPGLAVGRGWVVPGTTVTHQTEN